MYIRGYAFMSIVGLFLLFFLSINDVGVGQTLSPKKNKDNICHIRFEYWVSVFFNYENFHDAPSYTLH